jgi:hypothetical protein
MHNDGHEPRRHRALRKNDRRYSASVSMPLLYAALGSMFYFPRLRNGKNVERLMLNKTTAAKKYKRKLKGAIVSRTMTRFSFGIGSFHSSVFMPNRYLVSFPLSVLLMSR